MNLPSKLLPIIAMVFLMALGMGLMVPALPQLALSVGARASDSGLLLSSFGAARLVIGMPAGAASDRIGRRVVMIGGVGLFALGSLAVLAANSMPLLALCLMLQGCGSGCYVTAALAAVADLAEEGGRGRLMSFYQAGVLAGVSIGPAAGGLIIGSLGTKGPFLVQGIAAGVGGVFGAVMLAETGRASANHTPKAQSLRSRIAVLMEPSMLGICAVMFSSYVARVVSSWQVVPILAHENFAYSPERIGVLLTAGALGNFVALPATSWTIENWGSRRVVLIGSALSLLGLGFLIVPPSEVLLWSSVLLMGASGSMLATSCASYVAEISRSGHGLTMGALRTSGDIGLVVGPLMLTALLRQSGLDLRAGLVGICVMMVLLVGSFIAMSNSEAPK